MGKDVIVACDFSSREETMAFLDNFKGRKPFVKIGMELFYAEGPQIVREIKKRGHKVFLDLKLHDIPNTVKGGMQSLRDLGVDMTNVHASGGIRMMKAAVEGLTAVTQLTSTSQETMTEELLIDRPIADVVVQYAKNALAAGLEGVVCSPLEAGRIHEEVGADFQTITPGIRFAGDAVGDQARVTTPAKAREIGSGSIGRRNIRTEETDRCPEHGR